MNDFRFVAMGSEMQAGISFCLRSCAMLKSSHRNISNSTNETPTTTVSSFTLSFQTQN